MRLHGIHYDVGTGTIEGASTRPSLSQDTLALEIRDIADGLHANAIRIAGGDVGRLAAAGVIAARNGLEVWLSPLLPNADEASTRAAIAESARAAEEIRRAGSPVVLVVGCELSVFMSGILPGATHADRLSLLNDPARLETEVRARGLDPQAAFAAFLDSAVDAARPLFRGKLTYASGLWERVDWSRFDIVGADAYRDAHNRATYPDTLRALTRHRKAAVITELGCATYRGAAAAGGMAWTAMDRAARPRRIRDGIVRDEVDQARELGALLAVAENCGLDGAFIYTYVAPSYPSSLNPLEDLDAASYALLRSWPDGRTERKAAYDIVSLAYGRSPRGAPGR